MRYLRKRLFNFILTLLFLTFLVYLLMYLAPGDAAQKKAYSRGVSVSEEVLNQMREEMGVNRSFLSQYGTWLWGVLHGDLGTSFKDGQSVGEKLMTATGNTLVLAGATLVFSILLSLLLGTVTALRKNGILDYLVRFLCFLGNSLPNFLLAVLLMYFFCIYIKAFPVVAKGSLQGLFLPMLALSIPLVSRFTRQIRAQIIEELDQPYVAGLKAGGLKGRYLIFRNVLHNTLCTVITVIGVSVGTLLGGSVVIETVFAWKGVGKLAMDSISGRDYPVVQGFVLWMGVLFVGINLITDLCYHRIDPRINLEEGK